jgi:signal transduction histidine kinase
MALFSKFGVLAAFTTLRIRQFARGRAQVDALRRKFAARESELNALMSFVQTDVEAEKTRLARRLHDELGGVLTSAKIDIAWIKKAESSDHPDLAPRIDRLSRALDEAVSIERRAVENLRPSLLDHLGLGAALDWYITDTCKSARIACHCKSFDDAGEVAPDLAIVIYRVVQEAMTHIVANAQADEIEISLRRSERGLHLSLRHNGSASPLGQPLVQKQRLAVMRQRALSLGGHFELDQPGGQGTRMRAFFPSTVLQ